MNSITLQSPFVDVLSKDGDHVPDALFRAALEASYDSILITDASLEDPKIVFVNQAFTRMTGYTPDEVIGRSPKLLQGERTDRSVTRALRQALERGESFEAHTVNYRKSGEPFHIQWRTSPVLDSSGSITHYVAVQRDVSDQIHLIERLKRKAETDGLTMLLTRGAGEESLNEMIERARRSDEPVSVLMMDIDHFKSINDEFGHAVGDRVLRRVARIIDGRTRGNDLCIRWGGEEFVIALRDTPLGGALRVAESIRNAVAMEPIGDQIEVTVSCGVAQSRQRESPQDTVERADRYLYAAKEAGRNSTRSEANDLESADTPAG